MKQEIIADLSRITEEEQAILDGKTEVEKERYSSGQKFVMDAGKLLERGKLIDIRPHTRFIRFPAHSHNYVEMIYMCQGSTVHTINGERIELKTGELLILNQNAVQEIEPAGRDDIAVNFLILPEFFDQTLRMIGAEENQLKDFGSLCILRRRSGYTAGRTVPDVYHDSESLCKHGTGNPDRNFILCVGTLCGTDKFDCSDRKCCIDLSG